MTKTELERELEYTKIELAACKQAHTILSNGIRQALGIKEFPDFYKLYGDGIYASGVARYLCEQVELLKSKAVDEAGDETAARHWG